MTVDCQRILVARQEMKGPKALVMGWALVVLVVVAPEWVRVEVVALVWALEVAEVVVLEHPQEDKEAQDNRVALAHSNHQKQGNTMLPRRTATALDTHAARLHVPSPKRLTATQQSKQQPLRVPVAALLKDQIAGCEHTI